MLTIGDMHESEKVGRFVDGLKYNLRVEILKANCNSFEEFARMALNVDSAIGRARKGNLGHYYITSKSSDGPVLMEIGNNNSRQPLTKAQCEQIDIDEKNNVCYRCHKQSWHWWKCGQPSVNTVDVDPQNDQDTEGSVLLSGLENE